MSGLTLRDWEDAEHSQAACNLSGLAHSLTDVLGRIRQERHINGTEGVNKHPIVRLYVEQMLYLCGGGCGDADSYSEATKWVRLAIKAEKDEAAAQAEREEEARHVCV